MRKLPFAACLAVGAMSLSGCGTICNLVDGYSPPPVGSQRPAVYGGVLLDLSVLDEIERHPPKELDKGDPRPVMVWMVCLMVDLPLSCVGDTLTLPITLPVQRRRTEPNSSSHGNDATPLDPEIRAPAQNTALGSLGDHQNSKRATLAEGFPPESVHP